jgi:hypothetical protein
MINSPSTSTTRAESDSQAVDAIVQSGPRGAIAVAGIATAIVVLIWFGFYWLVFMPRAVP